MMPIVKDDRIVTVRLNYIEQEEFDYVLKHYFSFSLGRPSKVIKSLIHSAYLDLLKKNKK